LRNQLILTIMVLVPPAAGHGQAPPSPPPASPAADRPFADVPRDHWAYEAVEALRKQGILRGYPPAREPVPTRPAGSSGKKPAGRPATPRR